MKVKVFILLVFVVLLSLFATNNVSTAITQLNYPRIGSKNSSPFTPALVHLGEEFDVRDFSLTENFSVNSRRADENTHSLPTSNEWAKTYGGQNDDQMFAVQQTTDGGYVVAGSSTSFGEGSNNEINAVWILKLGIGGNIQWQKTYGGSSYDFAFSIQQTTDGGYIIAGERGGLWVLKLDPSGESIWQKEFEATSGASSIKQTTDGGYIIAGGGYLGVAGGRAIAWVIKLDANGNIVWQKKYDDGKSFSWAAEVIQNSNDEYIATGWISSPSGSGNTFSRTNAWILNLDENGNILWQKVLDNGSNYYDEINSIQQTFDGGYIAAGLVHRGHIGGDHPAWVLKLNANGSIAWQKSYGNGSNYYTASSIRETVDGGYIVGGNTQSSSSNNMDLWVLKLNSDGYIIWQKSFGDSLGAESATSVQQTADGGYVVAGWSESFGAGGRDALVVSLDNNGEIPSCDFMGNGNAFMADISVPEINALGSFEVTNIASVNPNITSESSTAVIELICGLNCDDMIDQDEDGIPNGWEVCGYDFNGDGDYNDSVDVNLPAMGADPNIKDIFVEIDYMVEPGWCIGSWCFGGHTHKPKDDAIERVVDAFSAKGIHLHVDYGSRAPLKWGDTETWGYLSDGAKIAHQETINKPNEAWDDWQHWPGFDRIKNGESGNGHFRPERRQIFHYAIFAHDLGGTLDGNGVEPGTTGMSRNASNECVNTFTQGASDFVVSLGGGEHQVGTTVQQAGVFMHELGHNLGLCHGGFDDLNYKPNFLSVMNYSFTTDGLIIDGKDGHMDYSNFGNDILSPLIEASLNEGVGLNGGGYIDDYGTRWYCRLGGILWKDRWDPNANSGLDWNCNGISFGEVEANINDGDKYNRDDTLSTLFAYNDWANLVFEGGLVGSDSPTIAGSRPLRIEEQGILKELTFDMAETFYRPYAIAVGLSTFNVVSGGFESTLSITATNTGALTATVTFSGTTASWFDLSSVPTSVTLIPSATITYEVGLNVPLSVMTGDEQELTLDAIINESPLMGDSITVYTRVGPLAWFEAEPVAGAIPHVVFFTDLSIGEFDSWFWDFGDGFTSTQQNPIHTYKESGIYTVSLTITGSSGSDTYTLNNLVRVTSNSQFLPIIQK